MAKNGWKGTWGDDAVELVKSLWKDGLSATQIAGRLASSRPGTTRNAVIGVLHRHGIRRTHHPKRKMRGPARVPGRPATPARGSRLAHLWADGPERAPRLPMPVEDDPHTAARLVPLADLEPGECRWPIGDPKRQPFGFCGAGAHQGLPYCEAHARRAYVAPAPRRRHRAGAGEPPSRNAQIVKATMERVQ